MAEEMAKWGWAIALLFNFVLGWALWSIRNAFVPRQEFQELSTKVALIERDLSHLPTQDDFESLRDSVAKLQGQADAQAQLLQRVAASVTRIEDYLLKAKA
ncbi:DUF2730 family protein (plasmid) [Azospirillum argentinense]|uniref:DUF2730 family protein n=1 Tax=Azospirillum argentinense TaxID=2970906 RepID=A0A4D8PKY5_9PROT|nr:DUF2730 family protein [Azospirillum argentinense]QCN98902.1 DUF2730 family protein [Azospirillum argentinense]